MADVTRDDGRARTASQEEGAAEWIDKLARFGYLAKGIVYLLIGVLAVQAAIGSGGQATGAKGVLSTIADEPFGQVILVLIALGLASYTTWRIVQALADPGDYGSDAKGLARRAGFLGSGLAHGVFALSALRILSASGSSNQNATEDWTARLLGLPYGTWLVGLAGVGVIGLGLAQFFKAYQAEFMEHMKHAKMSEEERRSVKRIGQVGLSARGTVFGLIGIFLIQAARQYDPQEAGGLSDALSALAAQPFGPWLLGIVALGLAAYGLFAIAKSRYRHVDGEDAV